MIDMKKTLALLLAPLLMGGLAGCSSASSLDKVAITFGRAYDSSLNEASDYSVEQHFDEILLSDLNSMVSDQKNFILLVYDKDSTCACWGDLSKKIDEFMEDHDARIFSIQFSLINGHEDDYGMSLSTGNNTIAIFEDGEVKYQYVTVSSGEPLSEGTAFEEWMMERVYFTNFNYISLSQLQALFKGEQGEFTVYFARSTCGDCTYVENHFLKDFLSTPLKNSIYAIDCDVAGIRYNEEGKYDEEQWTAFKDQYGLSSTINELYGYGTGYVPTFIRYLPSTGSDYALSVKDMAVYLNDVVDGESLKVTSSYYDETRIGNNEFLEYVEEGTAKVLVGQAVEASDIDENGKWKKESAALYHDPLLTAFLKFYGGLI